MEQQLSLFGECTVGDDGAPDPKCVALFDALDSLQLALTGKIDQPSTAPVALATGGSPQVGQFKEAGTRKNGCWPYV